MPAPLKNSRVAAAMNEVPTTRIRETIPVEQSFSIAKFFKPSKERVSSFSASMLVHAFLLFILSWFYFDFPGRNVLETIMLLGGPDSVPQGNSIEIDLPKPIKPPIEPADQPAVNEANLSQDDFDPSLPVTFNSELFPGLDHSRTEKGATGPPKGVAVKPSITSKSASKNAPTTDAEVPHTDHFIGRTPMAKGALLKRMGGTDDSEAAVGRGLEWLRNHQLPDGSWNFNHLYNPRCTCSMPGRFDNNPNAATAMALLAFLGAGQTNESGEYKPEVQKGLDFLLANGMPVKKGICFYGNLTGPQTFYTHGLVTIALSEAFAMTGDARLRPSITGAIDFLVATQDSGGGWRYFPGQQGDTSVVAWQLMALKSAQFSRIAVPQKTFDRIERFLRTVSSMRGSLYAYLPERTENPTPSMTAAGLLCRMYLDFTDSSGGLRAGIRYLDRTGPDPEGMYYNYYATQVMHHWGGPEWDRWNNVMREHLIRTQSTDGHATGSWDPADRHGNVGGRHYMTTLALLTLEVYYRHLPLYQKDRIQIPLIAPAEEPKSK